MKNYPHVYRTEACSVFVALSSPGPASGRRQPTFMNFHLQLEHVSGPAEPSRYRVMRPSWPDAEFVGYVCRGKKTWTVEATAEHESTHGHTTRKLAIHSLCAQRLIGRKGEL